MNVFMVSSRSVEPTTLFFQRDKSPLCSYTDMVDVTLRLRSRPQLLIRVTKVFKQRGFCAQTSFV